MDPRRRSEGRRDRLGAPGAGPRSGLIGARRAVGDHPRGSAARRPADHATRGSGRPGGRLGAAALGASLEDPVPRLLEREHHGRAEHDEQRHVDQRPGVADPHPDAVALEQRDRVHDSGIRKTRFEPESAAAARARGPAARRPARRAAASRAAGNARASTSTATSSAARAARARDRASPSTARRRARQQPRPRPIPSELRRPGNREAEQHRHKDGNRSPNHGNRPRLVDQLAEPVMPAARCVGRRRPGRQARGAAGHCARRGDHVARGRRPRGDRRRLRVSERLRRAVHS